MVRKGEWLTVALSVAMLVGCTAMEQATPGYGLTDYPDHLQALQQFWQSSRPDGQVELGLLD